MPNVTRRSSCPPPSPPAALPGVYKLPPITTEVSETLPVGAPVAFEAFADVAQTPRWLSVVSSTRVLESDVRGRPRRASFLARLERDDRPTS